MGRWTDMDSDAERLPAGFQRTGYDADTQQYTFSGPDGQTYLSEPGSRFGILSATAQRDSRKDAENAPSLNRTYTGNGRFVTQNEVVKQDNRQAVRMMLPFALLVFVFLILLFKLLYRSGDGADHGDKQAYGCTEGLHHIKVHDRDTCWAIAEKYSLGVDELLKLEGNEEVDCDKLSIGQALCVPL